MAAATDTSFDRPANPLVPAANAVGLSGAPPHGRSVMNPTLKAVIVEVSGGNARNSHINLRGAYGLFPEDCVGGSNAQAAGKSINLEINAEDVATDIDDSQAIFRERGAVRRFFADQNIVEGDLVLIERLEDRSFRVSKASKRGFKHYL